MLTLIATIVLLGVLIFVHELGHFLTAKAVDIRVPRFSIGFGPKIVGFRRGETEYVLSWIPLGGYVKMAGMDEMEAIEGKDGETTTVAVPVTDAGVADLDEYQDVERHFESKSLPARFMVISAGVIMNFLVAALTWAVIAGVWGVPEQSNEPVIGTINAEALPAGAEALADLPARARVTAVGDDEIETRDEMITALASAPAGPMVLDFGPAGSRTVELSDEMEDRQRLLAAMTPLPALIGAVMTNMPAHDAGILPGDVVVRAAGQEITDYTVLVRIIEAHPEMPLPMTVQREGRLVELTVTPNAEIDAETGAREGRIGITATLAREKLGFVGSIAYGFREMVGWTGEILRSLWRLVSGQESVRNLGGPVMIGDLAGQFARAGLASFLNFMAIFSVNLAVLNLLPIPVLDGGHLLFLTIEAVRGRALSLQQRMRLSQIGFIILVGIMVLALANDMIRLIERLFG